MPDIPGRYSEPFEYASRIVVRCRTCSTPEHAVVITMDEFNEHEAWHERPYVLHYTSADLPDGATWSVYRETYTNRDFDDPIDGSQVHVSTHATEAEADAEAHRLQKESTG